MLKTNFLFETVKFNEGAEKIDKCKFLYPEYICGFSKSDAEVGMILIKQENVEVKGIIVIPTIFLLLIADKSSLVHCK